MKKRKTFTIMAILIAVLVLGVGYAAISNVTLTVNGSGNIKADADFSVVFDTTHTVGLSDSSSKVTINETQYAVVAGSYTNTSTATMTVYLDKDNTSEWACFKIDNTSTQLAATLSANVTQVSGTNAAYFGTITSAFFSDSGCSTALSGNVAHGQSAYLKVTVPKGSTEPAQDVTNASFTVTVTATPA